MLFLLLFLLIKLFRSALTVTLLSVIAGAVIDGVLVTHGPTRRVTFHRLAVTCEDVKFKYSALYEDSFSFRIQINIISEGT